MNQIPPGDIIIEVIQSSPKKEEIKIEFSSMTVKQIRQANTKFGVTTETLIRAAIIEFFNSRCWWHDYICPNCNALHLSSYRYCHLCGTKLTKGGSS